MENLEKILEKEAYVQLSAEKGKAHFSVDILKETEKAINVCLNDTHTKTYAWIPKSQIVDAIEKTENYCAVIVVKDWVLSKNF